MSDVRILHRGNCGCNLDFDDTFFASDECRICEMEFGFGVPIVMDDGQMVAHLSCLVERHEVLKASVLVAPPWRYDVWEYLATEVPA